MNAVASVLYRFCDKQRGMKRRLHHGYSGKKANLLTRYPREAGANLLHLLESVSSRVIGFIRGSQTGQSCECAQQILHGGWQIGIGIAKLTPEPQTITPMFFVKLLN